MAIVISICSGKGGTGKTIISACLGYLMDREKVRVLLIDGDLSVRGLSALLYLDSGRLLLTEHISLAEFLKHEITPDSDESIDAASVETYRGMFRIMPSTKRIDDLIDYETFPSSFKELGDRVKVLLSLIHKQFDYILIDARAGADPLTLSFASISDAVVLVGEEDDVSNVTLTNYRKELDAKLPNAKKYVIINKSRQRREISKLSGFEHLGVIPFDLDVIDSYGTPDFWGRIHGTNFLLQLTRVWNTLAKYEGYQQIPEPPVKGVKIVTTAPSLGQYSLRERVSLIMGGMITGGAFILGSYLVTTGRELMQQELLFLLISGFFGLILMTGTLIFPKMLVTKRWSDKKDIES